MEITPTITATPLKRKREDTPSVKQPANKKRHAIPWTRYTPEALDAKEKRFNIERAKKMLARLRKQGGPKHKVHIFGDEQDMIDGVERYAFTFAPGTDGDGMRPADTCGRWTDDLDEVRFDDGPGFEQYLGERLSEYVWIDMDGRTYEPYENSYPMFLASKILGSSFEGEGTRSPPPITAPEIARHIPCLEWCLKRLDVANLPFVSPEATRLAGKVEVHLLLLKRMYSNASFYLGEMAPYEVDRIRRGAPSGLVMGRQASLTDLMPELVLQHIAIYLSDKDFLSLASSCKSMHGMWAVTANERFHARRLHQAEHDAYVSDILAASFLEAAKQGDGTYMLDADTMQTLRDRIHDPDRGRVCYPLQGDDDGGDRGEGGGEDQREGDGGGRCIV